MGKLIALWKTKIPCQQRKLIQGILRNSVTDFYLHWSLAQKVSYVTIYTHKFTVGLYFLMNGGKTVCISFLCGQTVFSPLPDTRVWNKDDGKETKNIIQQDYLCKNDTVSVLDCAPARAVRGVGRIATPHVLVLLRQKDNNVPLKEWGAWGVDVWLVTLFYVKF